MNKDVKWAVNFFDTVATADLKDNNNLLAMIAIRDGLLNHPDLLLSLGTCNAIASSVEISLPDSLSREEVISISDAFTGAISNLISYLIKNKFSPLDIVNMPDGMKLVLS